MILKEEETKNNNVIKTPNLWKPNLKREKKMEGKVKSRRGKKKEKEEEEEKDKKSHRQER